MLGLISESNTKICSYSLDYFSSKRLSHLIGNVFVRWYKKKQSSNALSFNLDLILSVIVFLLINPEKQELNVDMKSSWLRIQQKYFQPALVFHIYDFYPDVITINNEHCGSPV